MCSSLNAFAFSARCTLLMDMGSVDLCKVSNCEGLKIQPQKCRRKERGGTQAVHHLFKLMNRNDFHGRLHLDR